MNSNKASGKPAGKARPGSALWNRIRPAAFSDARFHPYRVVAVAAGLAVAISAATFIGNSGDGGSTTAEPQSVSESTAPQPSASPSPQGTPAQQWRAAVIDDFRALNGTVISYQQVLQSWQEGTASETDLKGIFDLGVRNFTDTREALAVREPFPKAPRALENFRISAALYLESARIGRSTLAVPEGQLRAQLRNQVDRLRNLADRVYDQAEVQIDRFLPEPIDDPNIKLFRPPEVPDFAFQGIAVGPPLDTPKPTPTEQRAYIADEDKAQRSFSAYAAIVDATVPSVRELATAITTGTTAELRTVARKFTNAADILYESPNPQGERVVSTLVQLGLLVDAEAARAAQAATLLSGVTQAELQTSAKRLALLGDRLWDERLGERDSGFSESLLSD